MSTRPIRERILNTRLVREQTPMRGRELIAYLTLSALIALPAVFGLWQQNVFVRSRFEIESLRKEKLALQERYQCLRTEKAALESLPRIATVSRRYGLVPRDEAKAISIVAPAPHRPQDAAGGATPAAARTLPPPGAGAPLTPAGMTPPL